MRKSVIIALGLAMLAAPETAFAKCVQVIGSFDVSCENNVAVYRHKAKNIRNAGPSAAQVRLETAKMRNETARQKIAAQREIAREQAALKSQQLEAEMKRDQRKTRRARKRYGNLYGRGYGAGYGSYGYRRSGYVTVSRPHRSRRRAVRRSRH